MFRIYAEANNASGTSKWMQSSTSYSYLSPLILSILLLLCAGEKKMPRATPTSVMDAISEIIQRISSFFHECCRIMMVIMIHMWRVALMTMMIIVAIIFVVDVCVLDDALGRCCEPVSSESLIVYDRVYARVRTGWQNSKRRNLHSAPAFGKNQRS